MELTRREGAALPVARLDRISRSVAFTAGLLKDNRAGYIFRGARADLSCIKVAPTGLPTEVRQGAIPCKLNDLLA
jgi:hypothetical protein